MEEITYKYSKYNVVLDTDNEDNEEVTIFNTYSGKYTTVSRDIYEEIKDETDLESGDFPDYLIPLGIFVPTNLDEFQLVKEANCKFVHTQNHLIIILACSSRCNYNCIYCFEKDQLRFCKHTDMNLQTQNDVVDFIIKECEKRPDLKSCQIQMLGGEPTLVPEQFKYIILGIKPYFEQKNIRFISHIVSNGYLLTGDLVDDLKESCNLLTGQVTLDALDRNEYARLKGCKPECFDRVIENLKAIQDKIQVEIRLNVSDNVEELKKLISYLASLELHLTIYFDNVRDYNSTPQEYKSVYENYVDSEKELDDYIKENGLEYLFPARFKKHSLRNCAACGANTTNQFVIDSQGKLYTCMDYIFNPEFIAGSIYEGITNKAEYERYVNNPLKEECADCSYLPICAGHCTVETKKLPDANICDAHRIILNRKLQRYIASTI